MNVIRTKGILKVKGFENEPISHRIIIFLLIFSGVVYFNVNGQRLKTQGGIK